MNTVSARDAHNNLSAIMNNSQHEPVVIEKNGKPFSVVISVREFEHLERLKMEEEARIDARIAEAEKSLVDDGGVPLPDAFDEVRSVLIAERNKNEI